MPKRRFNTLKYTPARFLKLLGRPFFQLFTLFVIGVFSAAEIKITLPHPRLPPFPATAFLVILFTSFVYFWIFRDLPSPNRLTTLPKQTTQIFDRHGTLLYQIYDGENRTLLQLEDIPLTVRQATIAIEDKNFYQHQGFSLKGILRAFQRNLFHNQTQGGSTITQQLIKNTLLTREKTLSRKIKEIILAIHTELLFSKDEILQMYLNQVAYGGTAYGIQAAAQQYFGKNAADLTTAEAALLAGLPQAPTRYSPFGAHPELAKQRQLAVLQRLVEDGYLSASAYLTSAQEKLEFLSPSTSIQAPHFVMYVKDQLVNLFGEDAVLHGGLQVYTTLDLNLQKTAQSIANQELKRLTPYRVGNAAVLITNPQTGDILAMVGSKDYFDVKHDGQVNLTTALRQPGSAIKPVNYALAFEKGLSPSSLIDDSPITFTTPGSPSWSPKNYDGRFHGRISLRTALASSYNVPAVKLLAQNGISQMITLGQKLGITTWTDPSRFGLSLTLGGLEVKMTDLSEVYGTFANSGRRQKLRSLLSATDFHNNPLQLPPPPSEAVLSPQTAYLITDILSDPSARAPAFGFNSILNLKDVAVKTGTSNDLRDNWTIGYTANLLVAVWVGNNDNSPMSAVASGITGASPIWAKTIAQLLQTTPALPLTPPPGIVKVAVCSLTNTLACPACPLVRMETFVAGKQPRATCTDDQIKALLQQPPSPTTNPADLPAGLSAVEDRQVLSGITTNR